MHSLPVALAWAALGCAIAASAQPPSPPPACAAPQHREFDFWLGVWDVHDTAGKRLGENRITRIHGGCALLEEWRGSSGFTGSSLNAFDAGRARWHQTWVDSSGGVLRLDGGFADGAMTMSGETIEPGAANKPSRQRIRWQPQPDGRVRQLWERSADGGANWKVVFDGWYTRRP